VVWIPGNEDSAHTAFFGFKEGIIRIIDTVSNEYIESDPFKILGEAPFVLLSPRGGETFSDTDTVKVYYSHNQDISGNITVCAKAGSDSVDWVREVGITNRISQALPIKNMVTAFVPQDLARQKPDYFDFSFPLKIYLKDYGPTGKDILSGDIYISP
jgi:hypothetical protein